MAQLSTISVIVKDPDFLARATAAAVQVGLDMPEAFIAANVWRIATDARVLDPYDYALSESNRQYPGRHGRIGFDPAVISDAALIGVVRDVAQSQDLLPDEGTVL